MSFSLCLTFGDGHLYAISCHSPEGDTAAEFALSAWSCFVTLFSELSLVELALDLTD